jgi:hypothetical protein
MSNTGEKQTLQKSFDLEERARIRAKLLRYMEQHRIGAPALVSRIAEKAKRSPDLIPQKTLQRFIGGQGRTNDAFIMLCHQFAEKLPDVDPVAELGQELIRYFELGSKGAEPGPARSEPDSLAGRYGVYIPEAPKGFKVRQQGEADSVLYSRCTIEHYSGTGPLIVREQVFDSGNMQGTKGDAPLHRTFEGVALQFNPLVFVIAKDTTTRLPRVCWLRQRDGGLMGRAMEEGLPNSDEPAPRVVAHECLFQRETTGEKP